MDSIDTTIEIPQQQLFTAVPQGQAAAAPVAARAVASVQEWTRKDEAIFCGKRFFRRLLRVAKIKRAARKLRVAKNDRAARKLGYVSNAVVMTLPYNTVTESSQDSRSLEQRSTVEDVQEDKARYDRLRKELDILPAVFWSMGKSFHAGKSDSYFVQKEAEWMEEHNVDFDGTVSRRTNRSAFSEGLVAWSLPLPFILGTQSGRWRMDRFLALAYFLGCPIIDRTETLNHQVGLKLVNLHPIPRRNVHFDKNLETIMLERAREALRHCQERDNQEIHVLWSGGIDTTAVLCAFLLVTQGDGSLRDLIVVRYTERSIEEYPAFFHVFIQPLLRKRLILGHVRDVFTLHDEDASDQDIPLVVTGDPADMLFGTFRMAGALVDGSYSLDEPWEKRAPLLLHERRLLLNPNDYIHPASNRRKPVLRYLVKAAAQAWVNWIKPQVEMSPVPVRTMFDWWWWITYSCKYNHDVHRIFYNREKVSRKLRARVFNFYESDDFHQYSFAAHEQKMKDKRVWASYKHPLKEFILSFCRSKVSSDNQLDDHMVYFFSKIKVPSVANSFGMEVGLDSDWNVIKFGAASISRKALKLEYGTSLDGMFVTEGGKAKKKGDERWVQGEWTRARTWYTSAQGISHGLNCIDDIRSCENALKRTSYGKPVRFKHDREALERHQKRGVVCHKSWDYRDYDVPLIWAYFGGGSGGGE